MVKKSDHPYLSRYVCSAVYNWRVNSFSSNYDGLTSNCATVIIDSDTGKVVDVMTPNPLYDNGVVLHWTRVSGVQANYNYDPVD